MGFSHTVPSMKQPLAIFLFCVLCIGGGLANWVFRTARVPADGTNFLEFMAAHPKRSALWARHNGAVVANFGSERAMPLASTVKMLIAVEYAQQVAAGKVRPDESVALAALDRYFLPGSDGGAHRGWLKFARKTNLVAGQGPSEAVRLQDVVRGMMQLSSNANADWLIERLGAHSINATARKLGLKSQTPLYSFVGSVYLCGAHGKSAPSEWAKSLRALPPAEFEKRANEVHAKLRDDASGKFKSAFVLPNAEEQKVWSDRLPSASARDYGELMGRINGRKYFPAKVQQVLDGVLEWPLQASEPARQVYAHLGFKGGATSWVVTQAFYGRTKAGDTVEGAIFFNDLTPLESEKLQAGLDVFVAGLFKDETLRRKLKALR